MEPQIEKKYLTDLLKRKATIEAALDQVMEDLRKLTGKKTVSIYHSTSCISCGSLSLQPKNAAEYPLPVVGMNVTESIDELKYYTVKLDGYYSKMTWDDKVYDVLRHLEKADVKEIAQMILEKEHKDDYFFRQTQRNVANALIRLKKNYKIVLTEKHDRRHVYQLA